MKKKILFIVNPVSGVFQKHNIHKKIKRNIDADHYEHEVKFTEYSGHATKLAKDAASEHVKIIVAVGGDGSINEVINGIVGTDISLGVIPLGSGNGYARHMRIPLHVSRALQVINKGKTKRIDVGVMNGHYFLSNAGVGFVGLVADQFKRHHLHGFFSYSMAVMKNYFQYQPRSYTVEIDGRPIDRKAFFIIVSNTRELGYHFSSTPHADVQDGYLDVMILKPFAKLLGPVVAPLSYFHLSHKWPTVEIYRAKTVKIHEDHEQIVELDGDPFPWTQRPLQVDVCASALNVIIP